ncbi:hypothetical protein SCLCIDRAFT_1221394 [Scleroderma citrinum Foug A]|uniref:Uncharacterized protein n=1 Tax=Scleroderma citrinum Foug A TaxID=1036808 RepID=A0A0C3D2V4_9AGAM|nr:hypothetical protein SCLCIDRAFT_1221394 [Scleroderma citrinum Foug A]
MKSRLTTYPRYGKYRVWLSISIVYVVIGCLKYVREGPQPRDWKVVHVQHNAGLISIARDDSNSIRPSGLRFKRSYRATMSLVVSLLRLCCRWVIPRKTLQGPHTIRDRLTFLALQTSSSMHHSILHLTLPRGFPEKLMLGGGGQVINMFLQQTRREVAR